MDEVTKKAMEDMMEVIKNQQETLRRQGEAMQLFQVEQQRLINNAANEKLAVEAAKTKLIADVALVASQGGIYGYDGGRILVPEEKQFHILLNGFGLNRSTADEVFRQGLTGTENLKNLSPEKLKNLTYNISRNKSPECPEPKQVFLGATFEDKITILMSWLKFQRIIGGATTSLAWNADSTAITKTTERLQYYREIKDSEGTEDIKLPGPLKEMKGFRDFQDNLETYLRTKRGAANVPLVYAIRKDDAVGARDRSGIVGKNRPDKYANWDEYLIRCVVMEGTHWESDNSSFWQILSKLVRDGPGWDYIRKFEKNGDGDGRKAYLSLVEQAFQFTNVEQITDEAYRQIDTLKYDGPTRTWNYDKYVRAWYRAIRTLRQFDDCPKESRLVKKFCAGIDDKRLYHAISLVLLKDSVYLSDFEETQRYFNTSLAVAMSREKTGKSDRHIASTNTDSNSGGNSNSVNSNSGNSSTKQPFSGVLEARQYNRKEWYSMTRAQQNTVREMRDADSGDTNKRKVSAVETDKTDDESKESKIPKDAGNQFGSRAYKG